MKRTFLNCANYKNGFSIPLYKVFDGEKVYYEAVIFGRDKRGMTTKAEVIKHPHRTVVNMWRESKGHERKDR